MTQDELLDRRLARHLHLFEVNRQRSINRWENAVARLTESNGLPGFALQMEINEARRALTAHGLTGQPDGSAVGG